MIFALAGCGDLGEMGQEETAWSVIKDAWLPRKAEKAGLRESRDCYFQSQESELVEEKRTV